MPTSQLQADAPVSGIINFETMEDQHKSNRLELIDKELDDTANSLKPMSN